MLRTVLPLMDNGLRNYLRRVPTDSVLYLPGLDYDNWYTGTIKDYSGQGNDEAIIGATQKRLPSGLWYLDFDGASDIGTITDATSIQNIFDAGGTVDVWVNPRSDGQNDFGRIFDKGLWSLYVRSEAAGKIKLVFAKNFSGNAPNWETTATEVTLNTWSKITVTYNSSATINNPIIYVNGVSVSLTESLVPSGTRSTDVGSNLVLGNWAATTRAFDGGQALRKLHTSSKTVAQVLEENNQERHLFRV